MMLSKCYKSLNGDLQFPMDICAPYTIYRDNHNYGTYYFVDKDESILTVIHKFECVEDANIIPVRILHEKIIYGEDVNRFNELLNNFHQKSCRFEAVMIDTISEPYQSELAKMVLSLNDVQS